MLRSSKALTDFVATSELYRKGFSEQLRKALSKNDELTNQIFELGQNKKLTSISYEIVQDKLSMLYESINAISNAKYLEDKFQMEIDRQSTLITTIQEEKADLDEKLKMVCKERDDFRDMVKEMVDVSQYEDVRVHVNDPTRAHALAEDVNL